MFDSYSLAAWLATYLIHSSLLIAAALLVLRLCPKFTTAGEELLLRVAFFGGFVTTAMQCGLGLSPIASWFAIRVSDVQDPGAPGARLGFESSDSVSVVTDATTRAVSIGYAILVAALLGYGLVLIVHLRRRLAARRRLASLLRGRVPVTSSNAHGILADIVVGSGAGIPRPVLTESREIKSPVAFGLRQGEICLPKGSLAELTFDERRCMLAHEYAHLVARDPAWLLAYEWFGWLGCLQPLNRIVLRRLGDLAEYRCDDFAVDSGCPGTSLASTLLKVAGWQSDTQPVAAHAMASSKSPLARRVRRALGSPLRPRPALSRGIWVVTALALAGFGYGAPAVGLSRGGSPTASAPKAPQAEIAELRSRFAQLLAAIDETRADAQTRALLAAIRAKFARVESKYRNLTTPAPVNGQGAPNLNR